MHRVPPDGTVLVLDPDLLPATAMALASGGILPRVTAEGFYYRPIVMDEDDMAARHWLVGPRPVDKLPAADRLGVVTNLDGNAGPIDKRFVMLARKQAPSARAELRIYAPRGADDEREETIPPPPPPGTSSGESVLPPPPETPPPIGKGEG
ncbi:MAG: hypothetical protein M5R36_08045 [Deltaproteobacteria bacterium]|nr:hypothetical protein [Deltaproteobacteria bacterium]